MAISLRRSRRATKKEVSEFNVGDIVEIDRQHGIARGRLAQLLTMCSSTNPRWLVKFDSQPYKDEEMYERAFTTLVHSNEDSKEQQQPSVMIPDLTNSGSSSSSGGGSVWNQASTNAANSAVAVNNNGKGGDASSEGEKNDDAKAGKKSSNSSVLAATTSKMTNSKLVHFQRGGTCSNDGSDDPSPNEETSSGERGRYQTMADRASAREARSHRRQAKIDDAAIVPGTEILTGKRKLPPTTGHYKKYKDNEPQNAAGVEVVKVKLLTGTLYLYHGSKRRVEFIRRV